MQSLKSWAQRDGSEAKILISLGFPGRYLLSFAQRYEQIDKEAKSEVESCAVFAALAANRGLSTISLSFVGKIGSSELAAAGLATSLANVTGDSVLVGISSAMQTLCGQV